MSIGIAARAPARVTRVLVVDDAVVVRRIVARALEAEAGLELAGTAPNGKVAMGMMARAKPDVVILDLEMPVMDGLETLAAIRRSHPDLPVIVYSHLSAQGASATLEALALGATDFALKPRADGVGLAVQHVRDELIPHIRALAPGSGSVDWGTQRDVGSLSRVAAVLVAASTGGPNALSIVLGGLPGDFPVPILIVQHMPPVFTATLAQRLDAQCLLPVVEATTGQIVRAGTVYIAPGGHHLEITRRDGTFRTLLHDGPKENSCRPAADLLFRSGSDAYGAAALAVVLTGMGHDGLQGAKTIRDNGGSVVVEGASTAVVSAMPGAVAAAGLANIVLPIHAIAGELVTRTSIGRIP